MKNLLHQVSKVVYADKKLQEERRLRGDKFNIFSVLGLYQHEVKLHSKIISELLNAKGSHGMKHAFLQAFIEVIGLNDWEFNVQESSSQIEFSIGKINVSGDEGGRIDIIVGAGKRAIIIENKIFADDQNNQLLRYDKYGKKNKSEFKLLYLNLFGSNPDPKSLGIKPMDDFIIITYKVHIKKWLERCIELSARQPLVRETIIQYLGVVNQLTNQTMDTNKQQKILELISENFESAEQIANNISDAKLRIQNKVKSGVCKKLTEHFGNRFEIENFTRQNSQIWVRFNEKQVPKHIFFGIESFAGYRDLIVGVFDDERKEILEDGDVFPYAEKLSPWWPNYRQYEDKDGHSINMGNVSFLEKLYKDNEFTEKFIEHLSRFICDYIDNKAPKLIKYFEAKCI